MAGIAVSPAAVGIIVLGRSAPDASATASTNEETLATVAVPANAMGPNGRLRITTQWSYTNSANDKTFRVKLGGSLVSATIQTTTTWARIQSEVINRNSASSQRVPTQGTGFTGLGSAGTASATIAVNTTQAQDLTITGQKASAGETLTLESYLVELLPA